MTNKSKEGWQKGIPRDLSQARKAFGALLQWHLKRGTRPLGMPGAKSLVWTQLEFAYAVSTIGANGESAERSVRNWCGGRAIPYDLKPIEIALFGREPSVSSPDENAAFRDRLRLAFNHAKGRFDPEVDIEPDCWTPRPTICRDPGKCFGRENEIARIAEVILSAPNSGAVLVLGNAGHGKTMLTRTVAIQQEIVEYFGARRWFVELERSDNADAAMAQIAEAIGLKRTESWPAVCEALAQDYLPGLILLDNLETPLHAPRQRQAMEQLLRDLVSVPGLSILTSLRSQETVGSVLWDDVILLEPLPARDSRSLLLSIARTIDPGDPDLDFFVGEHGELAGIPLAIFVVAHRVFRSKTLAGLRREWQKQGALLAKLPGSNDRDNSLLASVEISLQSKRMKTEGHTLFSLLGQLPGGLGEADCDALLGAAGDDGAAQLRSVGLLRQSEKTRIGLLPPLRDIALRRAPLPEQPILDWTGYYLTILEQHGALLGKADGRAGMLRLLPDMPNIGAAMSAAARTEPGTGAAMRLLRIYESATLYTGFGAEAAVENLRAACAQVGNKAGEGKCLFIIGDKARLQGRIEAATSALLAAAEYLKDTEEHREIGLCDWSLAEIAMIQGEYEVSRQRYTKARISFEHAHWRHGEADCISGLAAIADQTDNYAEALALYSEAATIFQASNGLRSQADCLWYVADMERVRERLEHASRNYEAARRIYVAVGHRGGEADCLIGLAQTAISRGAFAAARELLDRVGEIPRPDDITGEARWLVALAELDRNRGKTVSSVGHYKRALQIFVSSNFLRGEAECTFGLATVAQLNGEYAEAERTYQIAKRQFQELRSLIGEANCLSGLADLAYVNKPEAIRLNAEAIELYSRAGAEAAAERCLGRRHALLETGQLA